MTGARFPHSEIPGSKSGCRLPEAYRRLPRPSSAPDAKASTVCPKKLEHTKRSKQIADKQRHPTPSTGTRHHHLPEMLASTVQFSKNNRAHQNHTPERRRGVRSRDPEAPRLNSPFPQDPTACPTHHQPGTGAPTPPKTNPGDGTSRPTQAVS